MKQFVAREHEIEPIPGLPGHLPAGEQILWQGRPAARLVARHVLKSLWVGGYFLLLALWAAAAGLADGQPLGGILFSVAVLIALAALALGLLELFAWGVERTTLYTITSQRVVMRFGVALSMSLNLPFNQINAVALGRLGGKAGSIALALRPGHRLSWMVQWPHVRGWRFAAPEPALICLADADAVAAILAMAYGQHGKVRSLPVAANTLDAMPHALDAE
ncbi:photosynthetic complex putative assembly protein PuhB [Niveispirillum sp. BGYR6]|uniref:photosynthetic complex putative assembly protein PuhB n=1 Tax=Niveispirillum sp. BGYR6 TaxID=2971249 RepID=UPI0022B9BCEF|nr:photosynthetic complex putative assembly protein PuhB [Niveispirillum sp. BGYR6]